MKELDKGLAWNQQNLAQDETKGDFLNDLSSEATEVQQLQTGIEQSRDFQAEKAWQAQIAKYESNETGVPNDLLQKIEQASGMDLSQVRVYYNSSKPTAIGALAYTEGLIIYIAPGQEAELEHELWHVVQQLQGRAEMTTTLLGKPVDDRTKMEAEAEQGQVPTRSTSQKQQLNQPIVQRQAKPDKLSQLKLQLQAPGNDFLTVLGEVEQLSKAKRKQLLGTDYRQLFFNNFPVDELLRFAAVISDDLATQIEWAHNGDLSTRTADYSTIQRLIIEAPKKQRQQLHTQKWQDYFIRICDKTSLKTAMIDLKLPTTKQKKWLAAKDKANREQVADALDKGVKNGDGASWDEFSNVDPTDFQKWAATEPEKKVSAPKIETATRVNCWEYILLVAYHEGIASQEWIHKLYTEVPDNKWQDYMIKGKLKNYTGKKGKDQPQKGDIVFFNDWDHVVLSAGGDKIYSFWPTAIKQGKKEEKDTIKGAGKDFNGDGHQDFLFGEFRIKGKANQRRTKEILPTPEKVELTTIEDMKKRQDNPKVKITFGTPAW